MLCKEGSSGFWDGRTPDMVTSCAEALLPTQGTLASVHQVAKKLPASRRLIAGQPFCLCDTARQSNLTKLPSRLRLLADLLCVLVRSGFTCVTLLSKLPATGRLRRCIKHTHVQGRP